MIVGFSGFGNEPSVAIPGVPSPIDAFAQTQAQQGQDKICGETWCLQKQEAVKKDRTMAIVGGVAGGFVVGALVMGIFA
jgi:hypothetical protein